MASRPFARFVFLAGAVGAASVFGAYRLAVRRPPRAATPVAAEAVSSVPRNERPRVPRFSRPAPAGPTPGPTDEQAARLAELETARERAVKQAHGPQQLDALLSQLEAQATRQRHVTAFEVEPGLAAIDAALENQAEEARLARRMAFTDRMGQLSRSLDPPPPGPPGAPLVVDTIQPTNPTGGHIP